MNLKNLNRFQIDVMAEKMGLSSKGSKAQVIARIEEAQANNLQSLQNKVQSEGRTVRMMAMNDLTRRYEEVFPEDEFNLEDLIPMFRGEGNQWHSIPGVSIYDAHELWISQNS